MYEKSCASSNHIKSWKDIDFGTAEYEVKKLQMRIAKAVKENIWSGPLLLAQPTQQCGILGFAVNGGLLSSFSSPHFPVSLFFLISY